MDTPTISQPWPVVGCTGHRIQLLTPDQQDWCRYHLRRAAVWCRDQRRTHTGISGMAVGTDLWWADAVNLAGLRLAAHIPCPQQTSKWPESSRREHRRLTALADPALSRVYAPTYSWKALDDRNKGVVAESAALIVVWMPSHRCGGTFRALCDAAAVGLPGIHLDPENRAITFQLPDVRP